MRPAIFLAPRMPPRTSSRTAQPRSPGTPRVPRLVCSRRSPSMDFTGYRQISPRFPVVMRTRSSEFGGLETDVSGTAAQAPDPSLQHTVAERIGDQRAERRHLGIVVAYGRTEPQ